MLRLTALACLGCLLLLEAGAAEPKGLEVAAQERAVDPAAWKPPASAPEFRELVKGEEFKRRLAAALANVKKSELAASKLPAWGIRIIRVEPGSRAERLGICKGMFIVSLNGKTFSTYRAYNRAHTRLASTSTENLKLEVISPRGQRRVMSIPTGRLGYYYTDSWRPERTYFRSGKREAKHEDLVLAGCIARSTDPKLAETAWFHVAAAGRKPDYLALACGAEIAFLQHDYDRAIRFGLAALRLSPKAKDAPKLQRVVYHSAVAGFRLEVARSMVRADKTALEGCTAGLEEVLAAHRALPGERRAALPPRRLAAGKGRRDIIRRARPRNNFSGWQLKHAAKHGSLQIRAFTDHYNPVAFGPAVKDIEISTRFRIKVSDGKRASFARVFGIGVLDEDSPRFRGGARSGVVSGAFALEVRDNRNLMVHTDKRALHLDINSYPHLRFGFREENSFRMVVCGDRCEMFLNGRRIFYGPRFPKAVKLVPFFKVVGMNVKLNDLKVSELVDGPGDIKKPEDPGEKPKEVF